MAKINVLDEHLINLIAAGEVIERMASVVKELVENSIDAGASTININLVDSGLKEITVSDNGEGMEEVDMKKAILPHATSKISRDSDLFSICTLGFRGEALASIVSVSNVKIKSSTGGRGFMMGIKAGKVTSEAYIGHPQGTEIQVRDLFFNTPARLQNLKSIQAELSYITDFVTKIAMANPHIAFKLTNNNNKVFQSYGNGVLLEVVSSVYDISTAKNMMSIAESNNLFRISGLISNISVTKASKNNMTIIVNGRVVRNNSILNAIIEGYKTLLTVGRFPVCVLEIGVDYSLVDVNVHPTKSEVRFSDENKLLELITTTVSKTLLSKNLIVNNDEVDDEEVEELTEEIEYEEVNHTETNEELINPSLTDDIENEDLDLFCEKEIEYDLPKQENEVVIDSKQQVEYQKQSFDFVNSKIRETNDEINDITELNLVGQLFGTYILAQNDEYFYMIDQHAANERINYEKIMTNLKNEKVLKYEIMVPVSLSFTQSEILLIKDRMEVINNLGIDLEEFGGGTFVIRSVPIWINQNNIKDYVENIIMQVISNKKTTKEEFLDNLSKSLACKRSIKANEYMNVNQIQYLLEDLIKCKNPYTCPHGRPIIIKHSKYQVEKWFKRVQ